MCTCPVRSPKAAIYAPGIEYASEWIPNVRKGIRFSGQSAGTTYLDYRILALGKIQHFRQVDPRLLGGRGRAGGGAPGAGIRYCRMVQSSN